MKARQFAIFAFGALVAFAFGVYAQSGGYPSRIRALTLDLVQNDPVLLLNELDGAADQKRWKVRSTAGAFNITRTNDAGANLQDFFSISADRSDVTLNGVSVLPQSGTFTATFDDCCTTSPTIVFDYQRIGNLVTVVATTSTGGVTGDSTNFATTGTPVPAAIRPAAAVTLFVSNTGATNNGAETPFCLSITPAGNVVLFRDTAGSAGCGANWTAAGGRSAQAVGTHLAYMLGNP